MEAKPVLQSQVFSGNAAVAYAAFNLRDPYYYQMAELVVAEAKQVAKARHFYSRRLIDLGAGIGISTMVAKRYSIERLGEPPREIIAVEPDEGMRYICQLNFMGDPSVKVVAGKAQNLSEVVNSIEEDLHVDTVIACQMFHLLKDELDKCLQEICRTLSAKGVLAFDLGPSNWEFTTHKLADHRSRKLAAEDEIMTELAHPLYQRAHDLVYQEVRAKYKDFDRVNLWPPAAKRFTRQELEAALKRNGFRLVRVTEIMVPIEGRRVMEFIRNGWTVFFRWPPLDKLPTEEKLALLEPALAEIMNELNYKHWCLLTAYHPTAVITAVKE